MSWMHACYKNSTPRLGSASSNCRVGSVSLGGPFRLAWIASSNAA